MKKYTDDHIVRVLKQGGRSVHLVLEYLYTNQRPKIIGFVRQNSGSTEDGKDILQDSITALYLNIRQDKFKGESSLNGYIYSIARNLWLKKLNRRKIQMKHAIYLDDYQIDISHLDKYFENENQEQIVKLFNQLGEKCKDLLTLNFFYGYSNKELSDRLHYKNEQTIRNKKYKCIKKLKALVELYPDLLEIIIK